MSGEKCKRVGSRIRVHLNTGGKLGLHKGDLALISTVPLRGSHKGASFKTKTNKHLIILMSACTKLPVDAVVNVRMQPPISLVSVSTTGISFNPCLVGIPYVRNCPRTGTSFLNTKKYLLFLCLCLSSELCITGAVTNCQETARPLERGTFGLTEIRNANPLPMIPYQAETQFISSQPFPVSVSGLILSPSADPVPCWYGKFRSGRLRQFKNIHLN